MASRIAICMKKQILFIALIALLILTGCATGDATYEQAELVTIRLPVPIVDSMFIPLYAAIDQNYFADEGLHVILEPGSSELNPVRMVSTGADDFGILGGPDTLLTAKSKGHPLVAIAIFNQNSNFVNIAVPAENNITSIYDLEGAKVGFFYGHISTDILRNTFRKAGVNITEVSTNGYNYNAFVIGDVQAQYGWKGFSEIYFEAQGINATFLQTEDYGVKSHGYTLFTTEEYIAENPKTVGKVVRAIQKGLAYSVEHPEEGIRELVFSRNNKIQQDAELQRLVNGINPTISSEPYGYMDHQMFQETYDRLLEEDVLEKEFDVQTVFTTEFLE
jgi:NitT/TauT family transport system substrate-binding protein